MSASNDELAQWAASFLAMYSQVEPLLPEAAAPASAQDITPAARAVLRAVDAGGVPAFMTSALRNIAQENGIALSALSTPNDVVAALRARCAPSATNDATNCK